MAEMKGGYLDLAPNDPNAAGGGYLEMEGDIDASYLQLKPDEVIPTEQAVDGYLEMKGAEANQDGTGYMAVEPDWLNDQWDLLSEQPWFRGFQSRQEAKDDLGRKPPGTFVVRVSQSQPGHFAISVVQTGGEFDHMLILPSYAGADSGAPGNTRYRLGTYSRLLFNTVPKLIAYYIGHPYIDAKILKGLVNEEKQEGGYMMLEPNTDDIDDYE
eukprot:m.13400 g.13400  ORF g.13400 m.13400 type:complete len:213 (+) comp4845_c2_seq1:94-732(+)